MSKEKTNSLKLLVTEKKNQEKSLSNDDIDEMLDEIDTLWLEFTKKFKFIFKGFWGFGVYLENIYYFGF